MIATKTVSVLTKEPNKHKWEPADISTFQDMQDLVGGYITRISLPHKIDLWINEYAVDAGLDINLIIIWDDGSNYQQPIFGSVFLASSDDEGEPTSLTDRQRQWLVRQLANVQLKNKQNLIAIDLRKGGEF